MTPEQAAAEFIAMKEAMIEHLQPSIAAREQYIASIRRIEALARTLADQGLEPTEDIRIAYRALRAGVEDEAFELERPMILASYLNTLVQPEAQA